MEHTMDKEKVLPLISYRIFEENGIFAKTAIDENAFVAFVSNIQKGYMKNPYHNEFHAADVLQMCHLILTKGKLREIAKFTDLDVAALLLSAIVHDFRHPGVTNGFLINSHNKLAEAYNDKSVLENYHISETFKLMSTNKNCALFSGLSENEKIYLRKRMIGCVLGTDMAKHNKNIRILKNLIVSNKIHKGKNNEKIINPKHEFESKQLILELCLHIADCGNSCRDFSVYKELTVRLMEEFGRQGDVEKSLNLPVTFLCDRSAMNLPSSQIGFISTIIKPMVELFVEISPTLTPLLDNAIKNINMWKTMK